jgi:hypothetical protein
MAKLKEFQVTVYFEYADGTKPDGMLDGVVKGHPAIKRQVEANREWLDAKGHREVHLTVFEVGTFLWQADQERRKTVEV